MKRELVKSHRTVVSTFASRTSPSTDQSLQKSFHLSNADKIELKKITFPSENKKYATAQTGTTNTMTVKLNSDNGLQGRRTEHQPVTAVWRNGGFSASYDSLVVGSSAVLRLNFCAKNPPLRQAAKRYAQPARTTDMKYSSIIIILFLFSCSTTNKNNFLDHEKILLDKILLSNLTHFDTLTKDTLIVSLRPHIWCGTDKGIYVNGNSLFDDVNERATKYGFKKVVLDTNDVLDINQPLYKNIPHYSLLISLSSDKGRIQQTYYYYSGPKIIQTIRDTTIDL